MNEIKKFIECLVPITACNMSCHYCYVAQRGQNKSKIEDFPYPPDLIGRALSAERLGGKAYISICAAGETLLLKELPEILLSLVRQGHFVNITTNGTITKGFDSIIRLIPQELLGHIHFAFSFHYLELLRLNKMDVFFNNINKIKKNGCSFVVQLNLCDEYEPFINDIKTLVKDNTGAYPQVTATRNEIDLHKDIRLFTMHSKEEYKKLGDSFNSPLFDYTMKNFGVKRKEFCYAGAWSYVLNLFTGILRPCYGSKSSQNIFANLKAPIRLKAVGRHCPSAYCMNSSHFMALGVIPEIPHPTYAELRNRKCENGFESWYSEEMYKVLNQDLAKNNTEYSALMKVITELIYIWDIIRTIPRTIARLVFKKKILIKIFVKAINTINPIMIDTIRLELGIRKTSRNSIKRYENLKYKKKLFIFLAADYGNIGDIAITIAQMDLLKARFNNYNIITIPVSKTIEELSSIKKIISPCDIITIIGGGNLGDAYYNFELYRELIVETFKNNKVISFPQSINFSNTKRGRKALSRAKKIFSTHKDLTILAREELSYLLMKQHFAKNRILLAPDVVFTMDYLNLSKVRKGGIVSLRNDKERYISDRQFDNIISFIKERYGWYGFYDTHIGNNKLSLDEYKNEFKKLLDAFASSELVITDRLHGMIFCYITGTPAIVFPNSNFKIKESYKWIEDCGFIKFVDSADKNQLDTIANNISNYNIDINKFQERQNYFREMILNAFN